MKSLSLTTHGRAPSSCNNMLKSKPGLSSRRLSLIVKVKLQTVTAAKEEERLTFTVPVQKTLLPSFQHVFLKRKTVFIQIAQKQKNKTCCSWPGSFGWTLLYGCPRGLWWRERARERKLWSYFLFVYVVFLREGSSLALIALLIKEQKIYLLCGSETHLEPLPQLFRVQQLSKVQSRLVLSSFVFSTNLPSGSSCQRDLVKTQGWVTLNMLING